MDKAPGFGSITRTVCPAWDVHAMACHVLGMVELAASVPEQMRQMRAARKKGGLFIDALTRLQVDKHINSSPAAVVARMAEVAPRAAACRSCSSWSPRPPG